jgi:N-acyl-D-amino-acid deacylase
MRDEQDGIVESLQEMMAVGRESGCKIHLSHLKCMGKKNWGRMAQVLELVEQAHKEGLAFSFDQYPYAASSTSLSSLLPGWALEGGWKGLEQRVRQPETLKKILSEVGITIENRGGPAAITIASVKTSGNKRFTGKSLKTISEERKMGSEQTALELLVEEQLQVIAIYHSLSKEDVELAMIHFLQMVGSDGILGEFPHPRVYGTFPRVIHFFSRARGLFPLEEAIRKMTSAPADRLNLRGRGRITRGSYADILLFSPDRFRDTATFDDPKQLAAGLDWVFVNAVPVIENGRLQEGSQGSVIRREV